MYGRKEIGVEFCVDLLISDIMTELCEKHFVGVRHRVINSSQGENNKMLVLK